MNTLEDCVDWDVGFWASQYPAHELARYNRVLGKSPKRKLEALWRWKSLHRAHSLSELGPFLEDAKELCDTIEGGVPEAPLEGVSEAFVELRNRLRSEGGPLSPDSMSTVTPQFLLHVADSHNEYSGRFPILDVWVARAYRTHTSEDESRSLQYGLWCSRGAYERLIRYFFDNCENTDQVATLERALFAQGRAIGRYRELEGDYNEVGKLPVGTASEYLEDVYRHGSSSQFV